MNFSTNLSLAALISLSAASSHAGTPASIKPAGGTPVAGDSSCMPSVVDLPNITGMPDPLIDSNGKKVKSLKDWEKRREEMKRIISYYALGTSAFSRCVSLSQ